MHIKIFACALLALGAAAWTPAPAARADAASMPPTSGRSTWIVLFDAPPLAALAGIEGAGRPLASAKSARPPRLQIDSTASIDYRRQLAGEREALLALASARSARALVPTHVYDVVLNGVAVELSAQEAAALRALPGVRSVSPEFHRRPLTDAGPGWIRADQVWNAGAPLGNRGEGVVVGIVDSGINRSHPSFAELGPKDGYRHANPLGRRFGRCASASQECNDKLIGIYDYSDEGSRNGADITGHGSHVAGTAVGNALDHSISLPAGSVPRPISGVAPHANLISYKACRADDPDTTEEEACRGSWLIAAIDQAVADGVDIINYSIGGSDLNPWSCIDASCSADEEAMLNAFAAGVLPVVAAGNEGPGTSSVTSPGNAPWVLTVANASHDRVIANRLLDLSGGSAAPPQAGVLIGDGHTGGSAHLPIVIPTDDPDCGVGDSIGLDDNGQPDGSTNPWASDPSPRFNGEIVVCQRGTHARIAKSDNVRREGAGGFVLVNTAAEGESVNADAHSLPGTHLGHADGLALTRWMQEGGSPRARIEGATVQVLPERADVLSASSGRGPGLFGLYLLPDLTAPGTNIIAADGSGSATSTKSGTSMAAPHVAGAAALLKSAHPQWTPSDLSSALITTARGVVRMEDGASAAGVFEQGGGAVDVGRALKAGLSLRISAADYRAANPLRGGSTAALNEPALIDPDCFDSCSFSRRVTDLAGGGTWRVVGDLPDGATLSASPQQFTLAANATQAVSFTIDVSAPQFPGSWVAGRVRFERVTDDDVSAAELPVSVFSSPGVLPTILSVSSEGEAGHHDVSLSGLVALPNARFAGTAFSETDVLERNIGQDSSREDAFDSSTGTMTRSITVPAGEGIEYRLLAEARSTSSHDIDLYVGRDANGNGASATETVCRSASSAAVERCFVTIRGTAAAQTWWMLVQNYSASSPGANDPLRLEANLFDMRPAGRAGLVVTGPGATEAAEPFGLRLGWDDPTLLPGASRRALVLIGTTPERLGKTAAVVVEVQRAATGASSAIALVPGKRREMRLGAGSAQERLYIDVPPNASSLELVTTGIGQVDLFAAHASGATGPLIAPAPARSAAQASAQTNGAAERITLSGSALLPGRWYVTPVNTGTAEARVNLTATLAYGSGRVQPRFGAYYNRQRSGAGGFLYEAGGNWAFIWYSYLQDGTPSWYLGSGPKPAADQGVWTVPLLRYSWNGSAASGTDVGEAMLSFTDPQHFTFSWNLDGESGSEPYSWIDGGACPPGADLTGSWYAPSQSGYGYSINAYAAVETNAAYFYDAAGIARWAFGATESAGSDTVVLSQYQGPCPTCAYTPPATTVVGSFVRTYTDDDSGSGALDVQLVPPLSGHWNTSAPIVKLTSAVGCN